MGLLVEDSNAVGSRASMNIYLTTRDQGEPIGVPEVESGIGTLVYRWNIKAERWIGRLEDLLRNWTDEVWVVLDKNLDTFSKT